MTRAWYVVKAKTNCEERAVRHLANQGFEVYLPRYRKQIRHARKSCTVLRPLFPGYLFVFLDLSSERWRPINGTYGVESIVQCGRKPAPLSETIIEGIRMREDQSGAVSLAQEGLRAGDRVYVREGAFAGHVALLGEASDEKRVVLLLQMMGREVRTSASIESVALVS